MKCSCMILPSLCSFLQVSFGYTPGSAVFKNLNVSADMDSRIALVIAIFEFKRPSCFMHYNNLWSVHKR